MADRPRATAWLAGQPCVICTLERNQTTPFRLDRAQLVMTARRKAVIRAWMMGISEGTVMTSGQTGKSGSRPQPAETISIALTINGAERRFEIEPWTTLLDLLREQVNLTGTKKGCDHGQCGACTVLVDGKRINSCLALAVSKDGAEITTVEGLAEAASLSALQTAFIERDAFQCGYCTPGQICSAQGLLNEGHAHTRDDVRELMSGNLCRCGAYTNIADAVMDVLSSGKAVAKGEAA
jgi:xanthine dehydrogenase YagT iron-sulfur-binding subunit